MDKEKSTGTGEKARTVAAYYDKYTEGYLRTYGDTIQAFRPQNTGELHEYVMKAAGLGDGQKVLDAGCGVAGPACYFAAAHDLEIDGITISPEQKRLGEERIHKFGLQDRVRITVGDYHDLPGYFEEDTYDRILFLESLGHARDMEMVLEGAWKMLRRTGCIYIKDFFPFDIEDAEKAAKHKVVIDNINASYSYNVLNLERTVRKLRQLGFELIFIKKFEFSDDITARAAFEEMFDIDLFGDMEEFRVAEWLELKFCKPEFPMF